MKHLFWMIAVLVCGLSVSGASSENLVTNPGFEATDDSGATIAWSERKPVYRVLEGVGREGSRGLAFENSDPDFYTFPSQTVKVKAGARYEFEVWARTEELQGKGVGATICLQWTDANGKFLGGAYAREGVAGTSDGWVLVKGVTPLSIPENAQGVSVSPYVRRGMTGKAWFDDLRVTRYYPAAVEAVAASSYRHTAAAGQVTFAAGLNLGPLDLKPTDVVGVFVFENSDGQEVRRLEPERLDEERASATLEVSELPVDEYEVTFTLSDRDGTLKGARSTNFRRVAQLPDRRVYLDDDYRLIVDGQPFFPLGMYWHWRDVKEPQIGEYARSPFNCLMPYGNSPGTNQMDVCHASGLKVIYSIKDVYHDVANVWPPRGVKSEADEIEWIRRTVALYGQHPALLAWYINDELPLTMYDRLAARQRLMEELDPDHPTWVVLYQFHQVGSYLGTFDVIGTDPYPIPNPPGLALKWTRTTRNRSLGSRALWQVPQVFDWAGYREGKEKETTRAPTLPEMRTMAWQCIAAGANGLVFYSYFDLHKMNERDPFEKRWADVCVMAAEIEALIPVLLSVEPTPAVVVDAPDAVETRVWKHEGAVYLLAVNGSEETVTADIKVAGTFKNVKSEFGQKPAAEGDDTLRFTLTPLEPVMVRLTE